jgi:hypothetical protein
MKEEILRFKCSWPILRKFRRSWSCSVVATFLVKTLINEVVLILSSEKR